MVTSDSARGQVDATAAEVYEEFFVPALFEQWADPMVEAVGVQPGARVLDVGCGTGVVARAAARRAGRHGRVVGVDPNEGMLAVAARAPEPVAWQEGVAEELPFGDQQFDCVVCSFALMFCDDRRRSLQEMHRVLRPGGRLAVSTWSAVEDSPGYADMAALLREVAGDEAADALLVPFDLGTTAVVAEALAEAFPDPVVSRCDGVARFESVEDWVHTDIHGWTLGGLVDDVTYDRLLAESLRVHTRYTDASGRVAFDAPAIIGTAARPRRPGGRAQS